MNTFGVAITLAVMVAMTYALGYNSYNNYPSSFRNSWNTWGSGGGRLLNNGWNSGLHRSYRHKRSAYYGQNRGGHIGGGFLNGHLGGLGSGILSRRLGGIGSGWRSTFRTKQSGY